MKHKGRIVYLLGFLFSMPVALVSYINSSFLEGYVGKEYVGLVYIVASLVTLISLSKMPKFLSRFGNFTASIVSSFLILASFFLLAFSPSALFAIPAFIIYFASVGTIIASLDIFVEDASKKSAIGKSRGLYLLSINSAWVIAQILSSSVITDNSFARIYVTAAGFVLVLILVLATQLRGFKDPEYKKVSLSKTIRFFLRNKNARCIYLSNFILQFFYAWMVIYSPIYLHEYMGFEWQKIAFIFSIMLLPFVLLDFPLGKLSDKIGEKKMLLLGFALITVFTFLLPSIKEPILWLWAGALFMTRAGAATIEVMNDSYFFKIIKEENADEVDFFRSAPPLSYIIAPMLAFPILLFAPNLNYLFYVLSAILLFGLFTVSSIRDVT